MTRWLTYVLFLAVSGTAATGPALAESLVATHTIRSKAVLTGEDVTLVADVLPGALTDPADAIGMEARVVLYAGRAIRAEDLIQPALIERNQVITLVFDYGGMTITTDGRSLARAAVGEQVAVMNLQSRSTVTGIVDPQGRVLVGPTNTRPSKMESKR